MTSRPDLDVTMLRAVIGRIIPADQDLGALDLGADRYVMAQLSASASIAASVSQGLDELGALALSHGGGDFVDLPIAQQDKFLAIIQKAQWFETLAELAAEGFYADPANGGNLDALSWQMIGYQHRLPEGPNGPMPDTKTEGENAR